MLYGVSLVYNSGCGGLGYDNDDDDEDDDDDDDDDDDGSENNADEKKIAKNSKDIVNLFPLTDTCLQNYIMKQIDFTL